MNYCNPCCFQTWQGRDIQGEPPSINSYNLWSRGLARSCETLDVLYLYYNKTYGFQTWQGGDLWEASALKVSQPFKHVVTWDHVINWKHLHYHNAKGHQTWQDCYVQWRAPSTKSECLLITWFYKVTSKVKYVVSRLPRWQWLSNLAGWFYAVESFLQWSHKISWSRDLARSCGKLNTWNPCYINTFGQ